MITVTDIKQHVDNIDNLLIKLKDLEKALRISRKLKFISRIRQAIKNVENEKKYLQRFVLEHYELRI